MGWLRAGRRIGQAAPPAARRRSAVPGWGAVAGVLLWQERTAHSGSLVHPRRPGGRAIPPQARRRPAVPRRCRLNPAGGSASRVSNSRRCRCGAGTALGLPAFPVRSAVERRRERRIRPQWVQHPRRHSAPRPENLVVRPFTCFAQSGTLVDPYTGTTIDFVRGPQTSNSIEIDHVVSPGRRLVPRAPGLGPAAPAGLRQRPAQSARRQPTGQLRQGFSRRRRLAAAERRVPLRLRRPAGRGEDSLRTVVVGQGEGDGRRLVELLALWRC